MRVGIAHHFGWAVAVTASDDHQVVDRRRIELVEPGVSAAPIHYDSRSLDEAGTAELVARVRASVERPTAGALNELVDAVRGPIVSISVRGSPRDFPEGIAVLRRPPYEARADSVMYLRVLAVLGNVGRAWQDFADGEWQGGRGAAAP